jgi:hypothetical protein
MGMMERILNSLRNQESKTILILTGIKFTIRQMSYDIRLALMCGSDIPIPECEVVFHQPKMKEIALIGENDFFIGI